MQDLASIGRSDGWPFQLYYLLELVGHSTSATSLLWMLEALEADCEYKNTCAKLLLGLQLPCYVCIVYERWRIANNLFGRFVYWINGKTNEIQEFRGQNVNPGISSFATNLTQVADYMFPLFEHAKTLIPEEHHAQTLVYVKGTAGMRLLSDDVQSQLYDSLVAGLGTS